MKSRYSDLENKMKQRKCRKLCLYDWSISAKIGEMRDQTGEISRAYSKMDIYRSVAIHYPDILLNTLLSVWYITYY